MDWVKDTNHIEREVSFPDGMTKQELIEELEEGTTRNKCRKHQKKYGESLITASFQVQIYASGQWDLLAVELHSNLKIIL